MPDIDQDAPEFASEGLDPVYLRRRLTNWRERVDALLAKLEQWLRAEKLDVARGPNVRPVEELMTRHGVQPVDLPTLVVSVSDRRTVSVIPKALWVIGANGRVDILTPEGMFLIVDLAENFSPPDWRIAGPTRRDASPLTQDAFLQAVLRK